jgi:hypothetical protein
MHLFGNGAMNLLGDGAMHLFDYVAIGVLIGCMFWGWARALHKAR